LLVPYPNPNNILVGKPVSKTPLGMPKLKWEDSNRMGLD
jgi:hypothetical protein